MKAIEESYWRTIKIKNLKGGIKKCHGHIIPPNIDCKAHNGAPSSEPHGHLNPKSTNPKADFQAFKDATHYYWEKILKPDRGSKVALKEYLVYKILISWKKIGPPP